MRALYAVSLASILALGVGVDASAQTGRELSALTPAQQTDYLGRVVAAIAQSFQQADGATVRSNCVNRWYSGDTPGANAAILRNTTKYADDDPSRIVMAMLVKLCGRDKDEGMQKLRDRVAQKLDAAEQASGQALANAQRERADAEADLRAIQARAWRLPDGRRIYQSQDGGGWWFENGTMVPPELAKTRIPPK